MEVDVARELTTLLEFINGRSTTPKSSGAMESDRVLEYYPSSVIVSRSTTPKSSGAMESDGVLEYYPSSVIERQLRYLTYNGDGTRNLFKMALMQILTLVFLLKKNRMYSPCSKTGRYKGK